MKITQITIGWAETCSLPEYSNIKPSVSMTAEIEEGDVPGLVKDSLLQIAKKVVRDEIDATLELHGRSPKYYDGPLYSVEISYERKLVIIFPAALIRTPNDFRGAGGVPMRLERALQRAQDIVRERSDYTFVDCTDGDFSKLPPLPEPEPKPEPKELAWADFDDEEDEDEPPF